MSTAAREFTIAKREEEKKALRLKKDIVKSLNEAEDKLGIQEYSISSSSMKNASIQIERSQIIFLQIMGKDEKGNSSRCLSIYVQRKMQRIYLVLLFIMLLNLLHEV